MRELEERISCSIRSLRYQTKKLSDVLTICKKKTFVKPCVLIDLLNDVKELNESNYINLLKDTAEKIEELYIINSNFIKDIEDIKELINYYFTHINKIKNTIKLPVIETIDEN